MHQLAPGQANVVAHSGCRKGESYAVAIDENDAEEATRSQFCGKETGAACRVASREAVLAFARTTAAKPHPVGGLAVLLADH